MHKNEYMAMTLVMQ